MSSKTAPLKLDSHSIHLWCAFVDEICDEELLARYETLLSQDEQQRRSRFVFPRDQHRHLVTRALVRTVLSRYASVAPTEWTFATNAYGRPGIANDHAQARDISFNISHTDGLVVLGVAHKCALGVDTENYRVRQAPIEIADRFFDPSEAAALRALPTDLQTRRFYEYWTLKESYVKARAMGLSVPLNTFRVRFAGERHVALAIDVDPGDSRSRWHLWQFSIASDCLTAVCAERTGSDVPRLIVKKVVPFGEEHALDARDLRTSA